MILGISNFDTFTDNVIELSSSTGELNQLRFPVYMPTSTSNVGSIEIYEHKPTARTVSSLASERRKTKLKTDKGELK